MNLVQNDKANSVSERHVKIIKVQTVEKLVNERKLVNTNKTGTETNLSSL